MFKKLIKKVDNFFYKKTKNSLTKSMILKSILILIILILILLIGTILSNKFLLKSNLEKTMLHISSINSKKVFSLNKIYIYSSADAVSKDTANQPIWKLDISQYSDIAIFINNNVENGLTQENMIKELYIDNISFPQKPNLGTPNLYTKKLSDFGKQTCLNNEALSDRFDYNIRDYSEDSNTLIENEISASGITPIVLEYINSNIKTDYTISDISTPVIYNGSLLQRANVKLTDLETTISFNINIINGLNQHFICTVTIPIPLKDQINNKDQNTDNGILDDTSTLVNERSTIYNGSYIYKLENLSNYNFYRTK